MNVNTASFAATMNPLHMASPYEKDLIRDRLKFIDNMRMGVIIGLIVTLALTILGITLSSIFLAITGSLLLCFAAVLVSDSNKFAPKIHEFFEKPGKKEEIYAGIDPEDKKALEQRYYDHFFKDTMVLKHLEKISNEHLH